MFNVDRKLTRNGKPIPVPRYYRKMILGPSNKAYEEPANKLRVAYERWIFELENLDQERYLEKYGLTITEYYELVWADRDRRKAYFDRIEFEFRSKR